MHILQAASRRERARTRINDAARELAKKFNLPVELVAGLSVQEKDLLSKQVLEAEGMANLLEALVKKTSKAVSKKDKGAAVGKTGSKDENQVSSDETEPENNEELKSDETETQTPGE